MPKNDPKIVQWLAGFVAEYRRQLSKTPKYHLKSLRRHHNLTEPTQLVHVAVTGHSPKDDHLILAVHDEKQPDGFISSYGPLALALFHESLDNLDKLSYWDAPLPPRKKDPWDDEAPAREPRTLRDGLDLQLQSFHSVVRYHAFNRPDESPSYFLPSYFSEESGAWQYHGNLLALDHEKIVSPLFRDAGDMARRQRAFLKQKKADEPAPVPPPSYQGPRWDGSYAFFFPSILIGRRPPLSVRERIFGSTPSGPGRIVHRGRFAGREYFAMRNGGIGVFEKDAHQAGQLLNCLAMALRNKGYKTTFLGPRDLATFEMQPERNELQFRSWGHAREFQTTSDYDALMNPLPWVSEPILQKIIKQAERFCRSPTRRFLLDEFEARNHLEEGAKRQSFFIAWTVVENLVLQAWDAVLKKAVRPRRGKQPPKLEAAPLMLAAQALRSVGAISEKSKGQIIKFKDRRNLVVHRGDPPTQAECERLLDLCRVLRGELSGSLRATWKKV